MANGDSPVPSFPAAVWSTIQSHTWHGGGFRANAQSNTAFLFLKGSGIGECEWALDESAAIPGWAIQVEVSEENAEVIQDGTLGSDGATITSGGDAYLLHANPGTGTTDLVEA